MEATVGRIRRRARHGGRWRHRWLSLGLALVILLTGSGAALAWPASYNGRMYPGVNVLGVDLGGLSPAAAETQLRQHITALGARAITFRLGDQTWTATPDQLGFSVNYDATLRQACRHGRSAGFFGRYLVLLDPGDHRTMVPLVASLDDAKLSQYLDQLDQAVRRQPRDAQLTIAGAEVAVQPAANGAKLDRDAARTAIVAALQQLTAREEMVPLQSIPPAVTTGDLTGARAAAAELVSSPVTLTFDDKTWTLNPTDLATALVLPDGPGKGSAGLDPARLNDLLIPIANEIDRAPRNAEVAWDGGLYATKPSANGIEVDRGQLSQAVMKAAHGEGGQRTVAVPVRQIKPEIASGNLAALGITTQLGHGTSSFAGSSDARATNVAVAARHVSQTLIAPGDTFSFNDALGPITRDQGYVEGKIISGDWYASDIGGGVCQVSTTVYRAALLAGLPFSEWHPHSFRLGFYELDGWAPGIDAAIYQPNTDDEQALDLKFVNPTDSWMLLQLTVDGDTLSADLYGAPTGYTVSLSDPKLGPPIAPPSPIERQSAELPAGDHEVIQTARPGVEVTLTRTVTQNGKVVSSDTFVSDYRPQPEIIAVGKGQ